MTTYLRGRRWQSALAGGAVLFGSLASWTTSSTASAWCRMTTDSESGPLPGGGCYTEGVPLAWTQRCTSIALDGVGTSPDLDENTVRQIVDDSFAKWEDTVCPNDEGDIDLEVTLLSGLAMCNVAEFKLNEGNVNTITFVDDWSERAYDPNAFAYTTVWHNTRTGKIYDADMEINLDRGPYTVCPDDTGCVDGRVDLQNVITHEAGHYFGIAHSEYETATMYFTSTPGEVAKRFLRTDDVEAICSVYPPGSLAESCDPAPRGGLDLDCIHEEKPDRGCAVGTGGAPRGDLRGFGLLAAALGIVAVTRRRRG